MEKNEEEILQKYEDLKKLQEIRENLRKINIQATKNYQSK